MNVASGDEGISVTHKLCNAFNNENANWLIKTNYRNISIIKSTKSQKLNVSRLALQLSLSNPLKPGVELRMKM